MKIVKLNHQSINPITHAVDRITYTVYKIYHVIEIVTELSLYIIRYKMFRLSRVYVGENVISTFYAQLG